MTKLSVNGVTVTLAAPPRTHLADVLRDELGLTGTHTGCEHGVCGACTVLLGEDPIRACIAYPALLGPALLGPAAIRTIEGLEHDPIIVRLRDAFSAEHALQCGYCTPRHAHHRPRHRPPPPRGRRQPHPPGTRR